MDSAFCEMSVGSKSVLVLCCVKAEGVPLCTEMGLGHCCLLSNSWLSVVVTLLYRDVLFLAWISPD